MCRRILILSDIHANLTALRAVLSDARRHNPDALILLGDLIDYGMRPNEVIDEIRALDYPVLANIQGNHERVLLDPAAAARLSTDRGRVMARHTRSLLTPASVDYITRCMDPSGRAEITVAGHRMLLVHGTFQDPVWGKFALADTALPCYRPYDYVITGHSHRPHAVADYYPDGNAATRGQGKTVFINPGSVGQPRDHNPRARYALLDPVTGAIQLMAVPYDVAAEQALYPPEIDPFYRDRLATGV